MKKQNLWLLASLFAGVMAMTACSSSDDDKTVAIGPDYSQPVKPADMKMSSLSGFVFDKNGDPISGVTVTSGTASTRTDGQGGFVLSEVNSGDRTVVKFTHPSYMEIVRAAEKVDGDMWEVVMSANWDYNVKTSAHNSTMDKTINVTATNGNMEVKLEANGYKMAEGETPFNGTVNQQTVYLNPDDANFGDMMPGGDLAAERTDVNGVENEGQQVQLVSYGMTKVDLTDDNGNKLQISKDAKMSFPIPDKFMNSGEPLPAEIPLWSFDEEKGLWIEEGMATLVNNDHYEGKVPHFSWVNLDIPEVRVKLTITVKDDKGNLLPGVKVDIDGQKNMVTNMKGVTSGYVPKGQEFYVTVHSKDYANYTMDGEDSENGEYKVTVPAMSKDGSITITLPTVAHIGGYVINQGSGNNVATVWIEYNGKETKRMHTDEDGKFYIIAPADYQGEAKLKVRGGDGNVKALNINLNGTDQTNLVVNFKSDINAGGKATITYGGKTTNLTIPEVLVENEGGVVIVDDYFTAEPGYGDYESESFVHMGFYLDGYNSNKTKYTENIHFSIMLEGSGDHIGGEAEGTEATITRPSNSTYRIVASGSGHMHSEPQGQGGDGPTMAQYTLDVTMPLYAKGEKKQNVTASDNILPSFAPYIPNTPIDYALAITESPMLGKGGYVIYDNTEIGSAEFLALCEEAKQTLGDPVSYYFNDNEYNHGGSATYQDGEKYLKITWSGYWATNKQYYGDFMDSNIGMWSLTNTNFGSISIVAYNGYKFDNAGGRKVKSQNPWQNRK